MQRDRDMLVGQLVPAEATDWSAEATVAQVVGEDADGRCESVLDLLDGFGESHLLTSFEGGLSG